MCLYSVGPEIQGILPLLGNSTPQDLYPVPTLGEGLYPVYSEVESKNIEVGVVDVHAAHPAQLPGYNVCS